MSSKTPLFSPEKFFCPKIGLIRTLYYIAPIRRMQKFFWFFSDKKRTRKNIYIKQILFFFEKKKQKTFASGQAI